MKILSRHLTIKPVLYGLCLSSSLCALNAQAALTVFTCEPEWAALTSELAGNQATVSSATTALQDPHYIEARPSLIAKMRKADLLICTGLGLEDGWLPAILGQAANPKLKPNGLGYLEAGQYVPKLEVPTRLDRSEGDVHAEGNPHIQLSPNNILAVAKVINQRLQALDTPNAKLYQQRYASFETRWLQAEQSWLSKATKLKGKSITPYHKDFTYLIDWLGLKQNSSIEPKPGVAPSAAHLTSLVAKHKASPSTWIVRTPYQPSKAGDWLSAKTGTKSITLPSTVGGTPAATNLFTWYDDLLNRLLAQ